MSKYVNDKKKHKILRFWNLEPYGWCKLGFIICFLKFNANNKFHHH